MSEAPRAARRMALAAIALWIVVAEGFYLARVSFAVYRDQRPAIHRALGIAPP